MARRARRGASSTSVRIDLSEVESRVRVTEGDHRAKVTAVKKEAGSSADYLEWKFEITEGECEGGILYNNTSLAPQALWNLKAFLEALGVEIPDSAFDLDFEDCVDREIMLSVEMESYEGKKRPRVTDYAPVDEDEKPAKKRGGKKTDDDEEEEKPSRRSRRSRKTDDEDEEEKPRGRRGKPAADEEEEEAKPARRSRRGKTEDEEEDEPKKAGRSRRGSKPSKKKSSVSQDEINDMDEEELGDLISEHDLDVDLEEYKTLRKMRLAVIDAAEEAEILED